MLLMVQDDYGPLRTNQPATVPLWLARQLRRSQLCRIIPPLWLDVEWLQPRLDAEVVQKDDFQPLPFHYIEIATVILEWYACIYDDFETPLLSSAADDVPRSEQVRILVQRLREQRQSKIQAGLPLIDGNPLKVSPCNSFSYSLPSID